MIWIIAYLVIVALAWSASTPESRQRAAERYWWVEIASVAVGAAGIALIVWMYNGSPDCRPIMSEPLTGVSRSGC